MPAGWCVYSARALDTVVVIAALLQDVEIELAILGGSLQRVLPVNVTDLQGSSVVQNRAWPCSVPRYQDGPASKVLNNSLLFSFSFFFSFSLRSTYAYTTEVWNVWSRGWGVQYERNMADYRSLRRTPSQETLMSLLQLDPTPMPDTEKDLPPLPEESSEKSRSIRPGHARTTSLGLSGSGSGSTYYRTS